MKKKLKTDHLRIRLSPEEKARIEKLAEREGLPVSTWVRRMLLRPAMALLASAALMTGCRSDGLPIETPPSASRFDANAVINAGAPNDMATADMTSAAMTHDLAIISDLACPPVTQECNASMCGFEECPSGEYHPCGRIGDGGWKCAPCRKICAP